MELLVSWKILKLCAIRITMGYGGRGLFLID
jgi:hypothetical protein